jgi:hypothetical protein
MPKRRGEIDMQASMSRRATLILAGLAVTGSVDLAHAAPVSMTVELTGAQQVPPVQTSGSGTAKLTYEATTRVLSWTVTYSGLSSPATMAHFHGPAETGKNAGVKLWISKKGEPVASPITGTSTLSEADAKEFLAGQWYVNVHTNDHPGGEIRGQVTPSES